MTATLAGSLPGRLASADGIGYAVWPGPDAGWPAALFACWGLALVASALGLGQILDVDLFAPGKALASAIGALGSRRLRWAALAQALTYALSAELATEHGDLDRKSVV